MKAMDNQNLFVSNSSHRKGYHFNEIKSSSNVLELCLLRKFLDDFSQFFIQLSILCLFTYIESVAIVYLPYNFN